MDLLHARRDRAAPAAALRDADGLLEYRRDAAPGTPAVGAIHRGRVTRILADSGRFVTLGGGIDGFLPGADGPSPGAVAWVQVRRPPGARKPARLSRRITLPGRWLVATPGSERCAVSRRIRDAGARRELARMLQGLAGGEIGFVARTAAADATSSALTGEAARLTARWRELRATHAEDGPAELLAPAPSLLERMWLDHSGTIDRVVVDDERDRRALRARVGDGGREPAIELHAAATPLLEQAGVAAAWRAATARRQPLPGGGELVIEPTEALIAVDVDSGRDERRPFGQATNLEAATAIARLARVRDLRGTLVIDFVTPRDGAGGRRVVDALKEALLDDPARNRVVGMSETGLLEWIRGSR